MQTSSTRHVAAFAAALALVLAPTTASAVLERVGPNRTDNFLPAWYQDTTGLTMEFCTPKTQAELDGGWCLLLPVDVPGGLAPEVFPNAFSGEHFYWASDVVGDWQYTIPAAPGQTPITITSKVLLVQAIEAAFLGNIGPGLGQVFGRVRIRVLDLPLTGIYKFYTPWGIKEVAGLAGDRIFDTEDIGINCPPFQYDCALETSIGPFLVPSDTPGGDELPAVPGPDGDLFLSDPARIGPVTGSPVVGTYNLAPVGQYSQTAGVPTNPNVYAIEAPDGQVIFKSHDFSTVGRVWTNVIPGRVKSDRASYARDPGGAIQLHAFATGEPTVAPRLPAAPPSVATQPELHLFNAPCTGTVDPTGNLLPPYGEPVGETSVPMARNGNLYFASTAPAAVPAGVCVMDANARTAQNVIQPTYTLGSVTDQVFVTAAVYDPSNGGSLSVRASSSDQFAPPLLSVGAFGTLLANVPITNDLAYMTPLAAPPEHVRVHSQEGGTAELLVKVGSRKAASVTLTPQLPSPQSPGVPVPFLAACQGAAECLFRFSLSSGGAYSVVQDWSSAPTWVLGGGVSEGSYQVLVEAWSGLSPSVPDVSATSSFTIAYPQATRATGAILSVSPTSPSIAGQALTVTAYGTGATRLGAPAPQSAYQYLFWAKPPNGTNAVAQNWSNTSSMTISTPVPGAYEFSVWVRTNPLSGGEYFGSPIRHVVQPPPPTPATGATISASPTSPSIAGTNVVFTAVGSGSTTSGQPTSQSAYQFYFWVYDPAGRLMAMQGWGTGNSYTLNNPTAGTYRVAVWARTNPLVNGEYFGAPVSHIVESQAPTKATGATITASPLSPSPIGTNVVFTATGEGSVTSGSPTPQSGYEFYFWIYDPAGRLMATQSWGVGNSYTLVSPSAGTYKVAVWARTNPLVNGEFFGAPSSHVVQ